MADWDVTGNAPDQLHNPWAVKSVAPAPPKDAGTQETPGGGLLDAGVRTIGNAVPQAATAINDLLSRVFQGRPSTSTAPTIKPGASEQAATQDAADSAPVQAIMNHIGPVIDSLLHGSQEQDAALQQAHPMLHAALHNLSAVAGDALQAAPAVAGGAGAADKAVGALAAPSDAAAAEAASPAGQLGLSSTTGRPIATAAAGPTAAPTLAAQNQAAATTVLGADAGVPHGVRVTPTSLAAARVAPGQVLDAGAASLPTAPLSPAAQAQVIAARPTGTITKPTPNVTNQINDLENSLLSGDPVSGEQVRNTRNSLSSDANAGMNSTDADTRTIAKYKRAIVSALDQHVEDTLPANAPVTAEQVQNARATSAKNYNLQDLIGKGGDIDLQQLAADHRDNPNKFTGNTATVAQFASDHPEVTGGITNANRIAPPSAMTDLAHTNIINPRTWVQPLIGAAGRSSLRGPAGAAQGMAEQAPVAGLGGEFNPIDRTPQPPPGMTASPPTAPNSTAGEASGGQFSLADLLSHGVEQPPAPEPSAGPMGAPAPTGIPFVRNAAHEAGDLTLQPHTYGGLPANNQDLGSVMSQGVPEDIMQRAAAQRMKVAHSQGFINNNASLGNPASLEGVAARDADLAKGVQPVSFGADDQSHPMSPHDIQRRDLNPAPDSIFINAKDGTIINSGNMAPSQARAMLERWKAIHGTPLGGSF